MLFTTDTSATVNKTLTAPGPAKALRLSPWGNAGHGFSGAGLHGERDEGNGLYMLGAGYRGYLPALRRFNAPDNWSPFGRGGINAYAFCGGDPVNRRDPSGHGWASIFRRISSLFRKPSRSPADTDFMALLAREAPAARQVVRYLDDKALRNLHEASPHMRGFTKSRHDRLLSEDRDFALYAAEIYEGIGLFEHRSFYNYGHDSTTLSQVSLYNFHWKGPEYYLAANWITGQPSIMAGRTMGIQGPITQRYLRFQRGMEVLLQDSPTGPLKNDITAAKIADPKFWATISV